MVGGGEYCLFLREEGIFFTTRRNLPTLHQNTLASWKGKVISVKSQHTYFCYGCKLSFHGIKCLGFPLHFHGKEKTGFTWAKTSSMWARMGSTRASNCITFTTIFVLLFTHQLLSSDLEVGCHWSLSGCFLCFGEG